MKSSILFLFAIFFCFQLVFAVVVEEEEDVVEATIAPEPDFGPPEEWESNPLIVNLTKRETSPLVLRQLRKLRQNVRDTGCDVNLGFILQGDDFIDDQDFEDQKNFVDLLVAILTTDKPGNYAAAQYGFTSKRIVRLTPNKTFFLRKIREAKRVGGLETNIAAGLGYVGFQLIASPEDANALIVLGDGLESLGFRPLRVAKQLVKRKVDVLAVAIGGYSIDALKEMVGGDENKVFEIDAFFELAEVVYGMVVDICGFDL